MRCPTCRRPIMHGEPTCLRCGTNLQLLLTVNAAHHRLIEQGQTALAANDAQCAGYFFQQALKLRKDSDEAFKGLALSALISGNFEKAVKLHAIISNDR